MGGCDLRLPLIAEARADDAAAVVALWHACGLTRPWNDPGRDFALACGGGSSAVLVAREVERIVGSVMTGFDGHRGWIYYLAVDRERRRGGIGRALVEAAEAWLRERGAPKVQLMVRDDNEGAIGFYESMGMERQKVVTLGRFFAKDER